MFFLKRKKKIEYNPISNTGLNSISIDISKFISSAAVINGDNNQIVLEDCEAVNVNLIVNGNYNKFNLNGVQLKNSVINITGSNNTITIDKGTDIASMELIIFGDNHQLTIGEYVQITGKLAFWIVDSDNQIDIGNYSTFGVANIAIAEPNTKISIGRDCMFANGVSIKNSDFHSILDQNNKVINKSANVEIGNHVWIGEQSHILKGVTVNDNSIIALGSIVTKDVPANSIVAGNPAKVVKENINWIRERIVGS